MIFTYMNAMKNLKAAHLKPQYQEKVLGNGFWGLISSESFNLI